MPILKIFGWLMLILLAFPFIAIFWLPALCFAVMVVAAIAIFGLDG
jgi:hypothetical protein